MILTVDVGSSRLKCGVWCDGRLEDVGATGVRDAASRRALVARILADRPCTQARLAFVPRDLGAQVRAELEALGLAVCEAGRDLDAGIASGYVGASRCGEDRLLVARAALQRDPRPRITVAAGTAITVDAVTPAGRLVAGSILPGLGLAAGALVAATGLPAVDAGSDASAESPRASRSTEECLALGQLFQGAGVVAAIEHSTRALAAHLGSSDGWAPLLVAGGDAEVVARAWRRAHPHAEVVLAPYAVLEGLGAARAIDGTQASVR